MALLVKKHFIFFFIILALLGLIITVEAHSGRTDESGGHYDRSTGEYHYHHGYPAHQHNNGICPYGHNDNTETTNTTEDDDSSMTTLLITVIICLTAAVVIMVFVIRSKHKEIIKSQKEIFYLEYRFQNFEKEVKNKELSCIAPYEKKIHNLTSQVTALERQLEESNSKLAQEQLKIRNMEKAPNGITFAEDGMPIFWKKSDDKPYGDYTVYCSNRHTYHVDRLCAGYSARKKHIFNVIGISTPCKKCAKDFFDFTEVPEWFKNGKQE